VKAFVLFVVTVVVAAVLVADLGHADLVFGFLEFVPGRDVTGHFALFALLSFCVNSWLAAPGRARTHVTAGLAVLVVLEELSQSFIPARTFSLLDLSASLIGLAAGAAWSSWRAARASTLLQHSREEPVWPCR
jgi:hypothetical protein